MLTLMGCIQFKCLNDARYRFHVFPSNVYMSNKSSLSYRRQISDESTVPLLPVHHFCRETKAQIPLIPLVVRYDGQLRAALPMQQALCSSHGVASTPSPFRLQSPFLTAPIWPKSILVDGRDANEKTTPNLPIIGRCGGVSDLRPDNR